MIDTSSFWMVAGGLLVIRIALLAAVVAGMVHHLRRGKRPPWVSAGVIGLAVFLAFFMPSVLLLWAVGLMFYPMFAPTPRMSPDAPPPGRLRRFTSFALDLLGIASLLGLIWLTFAIATGSDDLHVLCYHILFFGFFITIPLLLAMLWLALRLLRRQLFRLRVA